MPVCDPRLTKTAVDAVLSPENSLHMSVVTAVELTDLQRRRRIEISETIDDLAALIGFSVVDLPGNIGGSCKISPAFIAIPLIE